jgi:hypothetical protein
VCAAGVFSPPRSAVAIISNTAMPVASAVDLLGLLLTPAAVRAFYLAASALVSRHRLSPVFTD